jgi:hypothetical protein
MGHVAIMVEKRNEYVVLVGKSEGKRPLGRHRLRVDGNIKMAFKEIAWESVDYIYLAQNSDQQETVASTVTECPVVQNTGTFLITRTIFGFSRRELLHGVSWVVS